MKKLTIPFVFAIVCAACGGNSNSESADIADSTNAPSETALSLVRENVNPKPVANFEKKIPDELNNWYFRVQLYETPDRFKYKLSMQYQEVTGEDTLRIPNLGKEPRVEIKPGKGEYSCILGFYDQDGVFREYKEVSIKNESLSLTTLKRYAVSGGE